MIVLCGRRNLNLQAVRINAATVGNRQYGEFIVPARCTTTALADGWILEGAKINSESFAVDQKRYETHQLRTREMRHAPLSSISEGLPRLQKSGLSAVGIRQ